MGNDDRLIEIHKTIGEVSTDIKWIVQSRKEDLERINKYNDNKRSFRTYLAVIGIPILLSAAFFMAHLTKNVDILCALHKPQMAIFEMGGIVVDPYEAVHTPIKRSK